MFTRQYFWIMVFLVVTPCSHVGEYWHFLQLNVSTFKAKVIRMWTELDYRDRMTWRMDNQRPWQNEWKRGPPPHPPCQQNLAALSPWSLQPWRCKQCVSLKCLYAPIRLHHNRTQQTTISMLTAVQNLRPIEDSMVIPGRFMCNNAPYLYNRATWF